MNPESEPVSLGGEQLPKFPTHNSGNQEFSDPPGAVEGVEVKGSISVEEVFENGKLVEEEVVERLEVDVEGTKHEWRRLTITAAEIAALGGWSLAQGVLHIDHENNERTLRHDEEVRIEVGISFAKKVHFKRG